MSVPFEHIDKLPWLQRESPGNLPAGKRYKNVMGTDGDLRKLKLSKAKALLRNFGVPEDEVRMTLLHGVVTHDCHFECITVFGKKWICVFRYAMHNLFTVDQQAVSVAGGG